MEKPVTEARFEHEGFPCVVLFMPMGHRCGYVGVPKTHPVYGGYHELDIDCHGGLTYAEGHLQNQKDTETWWIGFDCAHWLDAPDKEAVQKYFPETYERLKDTTYYQAQEWSVVRSLEYVKNQCCMVAEQLKNMTTPCGGEGG